MCCTYKITALTSPVTTEEDKASTSAVDKYIPSPKFRLLGSLEVMQDGYPNSGIDSSISAIGENGYFLVDKEDHRGDKKLYRLYIYQPFRCATNAASFPYRLGKVYLVNSRADSFFLLSMSQKPFYLVFHSLSVRRSQIHKFTFLKF